MQERFNPSALATELHLSCTNPSKYFFLYQLNQYQLMYMIHTWMFFVADCCSCILDHTHFNFKWGQPRPSLRMPYCRNSKCLPGGEWSHHEFLNKNHMITVGLFIGLCVWLFWIWPLSHVLFMKWHCIRNLMHVYHICPNSNSPHPANVTLCLIILNLTFISCFIYEMTLY